MTAGGSSVRALRAQLRDLLADRWVLGLLLLALVVRLAWVIWATDTSIDPLSDEAQYLAWADQMSRVESPSIAGQTSAFYAPGYPMFLVPVAWLADRGLFGAEFGAALVNVPLGVLTVAAVAWLTRIWFGRAASRLAAGAMALAPSYVALTSIALSENLYTPLALLAAVALSLWTRGRTGTLPGRRALVACGLALGALYMVRNVGIVLLPIGVLLFRWSGVPWRRLARALVPVVLALVVALLPWTLRNGRDLGHWNPSNTGQASAFCGEHHPGADGWGNLDDETTRRCYWGTPHLRNDREAEWYRDIWWSSLRYAVTHPHLEVVRIPQRLYWTLGQDRWIGSIEYTRVQAAQDEDPIAGDAFFETLQWFADAWRWSVLGLGALGLALARGCRRAVPLWAVLAGTVAIYSMGAGGGRFNHPILVLVVPLAAAAVTAVRGPPADESVR